MRFSWLACTSLNLRCLPSAFGVRRVRQETLAIARRPSGRIRRPLGAIAVWTVVFSLVATLSTLGAGPRSLAVAAMAPTAVATPISAGSPLEAPAADAQLIVKFKETLTDADIDAAIGALGGDVMRDLPQLRTRVVSLPGQAIEAVTAAYAHHPGVERVAPAIKLEQAGAPNDPGYAQQWALPKIGWDKAYGVVPILGSAKIAVLDTGVDATHPDLVARVSTGKSFVGGVAGVDPNGHGTALAGIAAANVNNLVGMAGVAYAGVSVTPVQVLRADGTGWDSDVVAGVLWAADNGASVILMGFSSPSFSAAMQDAVNYAAGKGVVLVAATGNKGSTAPSYPAGLANVIGVAATDRSDALLPTSNTGSAVVAAPGLDIYATLPGAAYGTRSGTSMAAAETAGLAALLVASGKTAGAASAQIRGAVDPVAGQSFGRINVAKALGAPVAPPPTPAPTATPTPGPTPVYTIGAANLMRLHLGTAAGPENYIYTAGDTIVPEGTVAAGTRYQIAVTDPVGGSHGSFTCTLTATGAIDGTNNSYTVLASDPLSNATDWTFTLRQYAASNTTCSGTPTANNVDSKTFQVAKATAYADGTLATETTQYAPGAAAFVVVNGVFQNKNNYDVTWIPPLSPATCTNTAGNDRPDSEATGRLPDVAGSFLRYPPTTGAAWNTKTNYDAAGATCDSTTSVDQGQWKLKVQFDTTHFVTLKAFQVVVQPTISINDVSHAEGDTGTTAFTFAVTLSSASSQTITVAYATADSTATVADLDYVSTAGVLTFAPGQTTQPITVNVVGDTKFEPNETFFVDLSAPTNATIADGHGVGTIQNDDSPPSLSIDDVSHFEGSSGVTPFVFTVTLSSPSSQPVTVNFATSDDTATVADGDYVANAGPLVFAPGDTTKTVTVNVNGDTKFETDETFSVLLSGAVNATIADGQGVGTIQNDDAEPSLAIDDVTHLEGNAGLTPYTFTVTLSNASSATVTVNYVTSDDTATVADADYLPVGGPIVFAPGETSKTVTVNVNGDTKYEPDETFTVILSGATNAMISDGQGVGTIQNDDTVPTISIGDFSHAEGNLGPTSFDFEVSLSNATSEVVTVHYATSDGTATVADGDYLAATGTVTFAPGITSQTVHVVVNGDTKFEPDETFTVDLDTPVHATIADGHAVGTIQNDDTEPTISIDDVSHLEGNSGPTPFVFTVSLSNATSQPVTVHYATADGTASVAEPDYGAATGLVTFAPGTTSQTITVNVVGDLTFEPDETFFVDLDTPLGATIADGHGIGTIVNDDAQPTISINDFSANEGDVGPTPFTFSVTLSNPSSQIVTVNYATADGSATVADNDYMAASGTVTFAPGTTSQTVTVVVNGDTTFETDETFTVELSSATGATIADGTGVGTIVNDDAPPTISIGDFAANEGNAGPTTFTFTVSLSNVTAQTVSVHYATADGSATVADADYAAATGVVTFLPGQTSQTISVEVVGDTKFETDERFSVELDTPVNATIADGTGLGTILNDDAQPTISINDQSHAEGNAGSTTFTFTVSLSNPSSLTITVDYATSDGSATVADADYVSAAGTVTFAPGTTSQSVTVTVNGDTKFEPDETFNVDLSNPTNATIADAHGLGTIENDDTQPTVSINDVTKPEGNIGTTSFDFTVSLSDASSQPVTVHYATTDGTATGGAACAAGTDYVSATGTVTFAPGETSKQLSVAVCGDTTFEPDETFSVDLDTPSGATIGDGHGAGTIQNDDATPTISISDVSANEGDAGPTPFTFTVSLSNASSTAVTVHYATADGTATVADGDYMAATGTVTFAPGATSQPVAVNVVGDTKFESNETFSVDLDTPTGATIADGHGVGTILNDDAAPTLSIGDVSANEGDAGTTNFTFTVTLSGASGTPVSVDYTTTDGTATGGTSCGGTVDYQSAHGTLVFAPGATSQTITVLVCGDTTFEPDETFFVDLSNASGATISDGRGTGTILNDDSRPEPAGKWTGGGRIDVPGGAATFGFNVERKYEGGPIKGELNYLDQTTGMHVKSKTITTFYFEGNRVHFGGDCTETTGKSKDKDETDCTFMVVAEDNGEPGKNNDTFRITVNPPAGYSRGGKLRDGNIQQHKKA